MSNREAFQPVDPSVTPRFAGIATFMRTVIHEVSPCFDPTGITCVTVANLMFEMLCVIADAIASKR